MEEKRRHRESDATCFTTNLAREKWSVGTQFAESCGKRTLRVRGAAESGNVGRRGFLGQRDQQLISFSSLLNGGTRWVHELLYADRCPLLVAVSIFEWLVCSQLRDEPHLGYQVSLCFSSFFSENEEWLLGHSRGEGCPGVTLAFVCHASMVTTPPS